ncbi:ankyrin repeat domain-containing protein [uncultured Campylobacter sp.]|uniref:ankyrin repeat domain-containing protein n=1 Tax=uncultured Campylobacter sp. TaxID=218934 RepID=UPI0026259600|nr:ankyrin repeat domain-containing protein [uncultured Campylobacter sp.]
MKSFKLRFIYAICAVVVCALYLLAERSGLTERKQTHFTVTADTNVSKVPGLSKYVSQEEVDSFAFRYWDIDDEAEYTNSHWEENATLKKLRLMLKAKDTNGVLSFLKDNNLSVNLQMHAGTSPLIYSAFYDDENTAKELIKLGADMRHKDRYKLSPLAYAIENNSTKTAKLLLDNGVKFEEVKAVQWYLDCPIYKTSSPILVDNGKAYIKLDKDACVFRTGPKGDIDPLYYLITNGFSKMIEIILDHGYKPQLSDQKYDYIYIVSDAKNSILPRSYYILLNSTPNYEPVLDILLKYNVIGQPTQEELDLAYEHCITYYLDSLGKKWVYIFHMRDYRKGEKILGGYGTAINERVAKQHEEERKNFPFGDPKPEKSIQITPDPIILNYYDTAVREYGRYCGDEKLTNLKEEDIKTEKEFDSLRARFRDRNVTFPDTKAAIAYLNFAEKYNLVLNSKSRNKLMIKYNGNQMLFNEYVKNLQDKIDKSQGVKK